MSLLLVMCGGAVGALVRYLTDRVVVGLGQPSFWGTFLVNLAGAVLIGVLAGAGLAGAGWLARLLATGLCGALTTYSTFAYEVVQLAGGSARDRWTAAGYATGTLLAGFAALLVGRLAGDALAG
ncbi:CrcB family protein [Solwaraspora sp. WMMD937]|uniref:fluoride efflux transporter FluC n=1 Tax=Solwaraspora sp. WMMD937 TaxID=3016090 RepID=UPI00249C380E|nr:CrcB family protein [Solwaraspora sp. WMMD937]WFE22858.1 CrcB family protein [Solwaraspora sp. WMMD937]